MGTPDIDDGECRTHCVRERITIVSVDYRLAPKYPFPTGVLDTYAALKWVSIDIEYTVWVIIRKSGHTESRITSRRCDKGVLGGRYIGR